MINTTIYGNAAGGGGGGIANGGTMTLTNSTLSGNSDAFGTQNHSANDIFLVGTLVGTVTLTNTIVATVSGSGTIVDNGHNLSSQDIFSSGSSLPNTDPRLAPLANYGGPTATLALCTAVGVPDESCTGRSPAIDAGDQTVCAAPPVNNRDQRGFVRPGIGHTDCSIGAYEADALAVCIGDCNAVEGVTRDEIETLISILFGIDAPCPNGLAPGEIPVAATIVQAVRNEITGCPG